MTIPGLDLPDLPGAERVTVLLPDGVLGGYGWTQPQPAPAALLLHGWGQDASAMAGPARLFAQAGWHAVSLSSRGWRGSSGCDDYGRSGAHQTRLALNWLSEQMAVRGPVVMLGFSMGGLIALLTATTRDTPATHVVAVSAPTDLRRVYETASLNILRRYYDAVLAPEQWREGSPLTHARTLRIPGLLVVGTEDRVCRPDEGRSFAAASGSLLLEIPGMAHEPREPNWATIVQETLAWTRAH